jgi:hypothetical protein
MLEITTEKLQIAYEGQSLRQGRMPMGALGAGLRGQALLIQRVSHLVLGDTAETVVQVDPDFESGSLIVPVHILSDFIQTAEHVLTGPAVTAVDNLITLLGFAGISGASLYAIFRRLKGRRINHPDDIPREITLNLNLTIEHVVQVYNDTEVQTQMRKTVEPLHEPGIEQFQTRRQGLVMETISKSDVQAIDDAELEDFTKDEEVDLGIEKTAWRRDLAWHFSDGSRSFDARIEDVDFWKGI